MLLKVLYLVLLIHVITADPYDYRDGTSYRASAGGPKGSYRDDRSYPKSPFPIITHPHSAANAAMHVHVHYNPTIRGAPFGTSAPAQLTKPPPYGYGSVPTKSYAPFPKSKPRYQPGAREAGLIPKEDEEYDSHRSKGYKSSDEYYNKGDYGYKKYGSDERYSPGYGPLPKYRKGDYGYDRHGGREYKSGYSPLTNKGDYGYNKYGSDKRYSPGYGLPQYNKGYNSYIRDPPYDNSGYNKDFGWKSNSRIGTYYPKGDPGPKPYYPDRTSYSSNPWQKSYSRSEFKGAYGPDKPVHGPWNIPSKRANYNGHQYSPIVDVKSSPGNPWSSGFSNPRTPKHSVGNTYPKPLSSFHVVDSIPASKSRSPPQSRNPITRSRSSDTGDKSRSFDTASIPKLPATQSSDSTKVERKLKKKLYTINDSLKNKGYEDDGSGDDDDKYQPIYKSGPEVDDEAEDDPASPPDCKGITLKDPNKNMSPGMRALMCKLYKGWGKDMNEGEKWEPTQKQDDWFSSLGSKRSSRKKRQVSMCNVMLQRFKVFLNILHICRKTKVDPP